MLCINSTWDLQYRQSHGHALLRTVDTAIGFERHSKVSVKVPSLPPGAALERYSSCKHVHVLQHAKRSATNAIVQIVAQVSIEGKTRAGFMDG